MLKWVNVNQYGTQGGHYQMTDAKRKEILNQIEQLQRDYKKDLALASKLDNLLDSNATPVTLEDHLRQNITMTGKEVVPMLQAELKQFQGKEGKEGKAGKFSQFYDSVLDLITKQMPSNLEVNYFAEIEAPANVNGLEEAVKQGNPAWFTTGKDGNPQINILRSDKPIQAQILVHELIHAVTVDSINQVRKDPTTHAKAAESQLNLMLYMKISKLRLMLILMLLNYRSMLFRV